MIAVICGHPCRECPYLVASLARAKLRPRASAGAEVPKSTTQCRDGFVGPRRHVALRGSIREFWFDPCSLVANRPQHGSSQKSTDRTHAMQESSRQNATLA